MPSEGLSTRVVSVDALLYFFTGGHNQSWEYRKRMREDNSSAEPQTGKSAKGTLLFAVTRLTLVRDMDRFQEVDAEYEER